MPLYHPNIHRCEHIKVNGTQCGSPAIRGNSFCYFHGRWREQHILLNTPGVKVRPSIDLPVLEDANSIQVAIMQVMSLLLAGQVEHKTAALLLYGLQIASGNLSRTKFEAYPPDVVINPATVDQTPMGENVWENSDFNIEEEHEEEEGENTSPEENVRTRRLEEYSSEDNSEEEPDPQQNNWDELRTQIAAMVKQAALQESWNDELIGKL